MNVEQEFVNLLSEKSGVEVTKINDGLDFEHDLNLTPEEMSDLITTIEEKYKITFDPENIKLAKTVGGLKELVLDLIDV